MNIQKQFQSTNIGRIEFITITTQKYQYILTDFGASIYKITYIENGAHTILTLTPENIHDFLFSKSYYGKTLGRVGGRLSVEPFEIGSKTYQVKPFVSKDAMLHGGPHSFSFKMFQIKEILEKQDEIKIIFHAVMKHLEDDLPGELSLDVIYQITEDDMKITYHALSTEDTLCNVSNHTYFTLGLKDDLVDTLSLKMSCSHYIEADEHYHQQTIEKVNQSIFDFRNERKLEDTMHALRQKSFSGLDHVFLFDQEKCLTLYHSKANHGLHIETSYPAIVLYTHNFPDQTQFKDLKKSGKHQAIAIECEYEPDGIHYPGFHDAILKKDELYEHHITYKFFRKEI